jgi:hypothetical protein
MTDVVAIVSPYRLKQMSQDEGLGDAGKITELDLEVKGRK